jgi:molybdopterin-guanine dinucleotide biosynthesis protein A
MRPACAIVLAGGRSSRFGSDKALALFRGEPLIAHVLRRLRGEDAARGFAQGTGAGFAQVAVVAKEPERYAAFGAELLRDTSPLETPLAGLEAGLAASRHELVFACGADMPFAADTALLDALFVAIAGRDAAVPVGAGVPQPLCALWRRGPALAAARELLAGGAGPRALIGRLDCALLNWGELRPFQDADTPQALKELE